MWQINALDAIAGPQHVLQAAAHFILTYHIALNALLPNAWLAQLVRAQVSYMHMSDQLIT